MTVEDPVAPPATAVAVPSAESAVVPPNPDYPVKLEVPYVAHRGRGSLFFPRLRAIGYVLEYWWVSWVMIFSWYANSFSILFTGRYREGSFRTFRRYLTLRYTWLAYHRRLVTEPPSTDATDYPVRIELPEQLPTVSSRFRPLYIGFLCFGQSILVGFSYAVANWVFVYAWWVALITGKYPAAAFRYQVVVMRRMMRLQTFYLLMTEQTLPGNA